MLNLYVQLSPRLSQLLQQVKAVSDHCANRLPGFFNQCDSSNLFQQSAAIDSTKQIPGALKMEAYVSKYLFTQRVLFIDWWKNKTPLNNLVIKQPETHIRHMRFLICLTFDIIKQAIKMSKQFFYSEEQSRKLIQMYICCCYAWRI